MKASIIGTALLMLFAATATRSADALFDLPVNYPSGDGSVSISAADFDNDNDDDVAVVNIDAHNLSVMFNNVDGTFGSPVIYDAGGDPVAYVMGKRDAPHPRIFVGSGKLEEVSSLLIH